MGKIMTLQEQFKSQSIDPSKLDNLVDLACSLIATRINTEGVSSQLDFLEKEGFTANDIQNHINPVINKFLEKNK